MKVEDADGNRHVAIVCGDFGVDEVPRLCECGENAVALCDWKIGKRTCDRPLCESCTSKPDPSKDKDLCPWHAKVWAQDERNPHRGQEELDL